jgi:hypothetical protein
MRPRERECPDCGELTELEEWCPSCRRCEFCCTCADAFDDDELGVDPEEELDYDASVPVHPGPDRQPG